MNRLYCPCIWKELVIENDGFISPCLFSTNKLTNTNIKHNDKKVNVASSSVNLYLDNLVKMREEMSRGQWPSQCINCRVNESKNLLSYRQRSLRRYKNHPDTKEQDKKVELKHLTFRVGNIWN
jgi:MoaA/NifB/PqqE/SkfB family radical SAM enzyme